MSDNPPSISIETKPLSPFEDYAAREAADILGINEQKWSHLGPQERSLMVLYAISARYKKTLRHGDADTLLDLATQRGYKIQKIKLSDSSFTFEDSSGNLARLTDKNSVQMRGKNLYVGIKDNEEIFDIEDLSHDVGCVLLGGKKTPIERDEFLERDWIINAVPEPYKKGFINTLNDIKDFGGLHRHKGESGSPVYFIYNTHLLDFTVAGFIDSRAFKYAATDILDKK